MNKLTKIVITLSVITISLIGIWFLLDKTIRCKLIYGKNICNFYAMTDIVSHNPKTSDFEKAMQLCREMENVPKKDSCFEYIAEVFAHISAKKSRRACNEIQEFNGVHSKKDCYDKIIAIQSQNNVVKIYLEENIWKPNRNGKAFCAYEMLGEEHNSEIHQYIWALCEEYYLENGKLREGGGTSLPVALKLRKENNIYKVVSHEVPGNGSFFAKDIERIFPKDVQNKIFSNNYNQRVEILQNKIKKEAEFYFNNLDKP